MKMQTFLLFSVALSLIRDATQTAPIIEPQDFRITFHQPSGCNPSDCEIFIGINTNAGNSGYLDFYLEGEAVGWVAVGFTETDNMFSADVVACNRNPDTGVVTAYDTWNPAAPARANEIDPTQDIVLFSATEEDGRIRCSVAKRIAGSDADRDLNLNAPYYVIYARRNSPSYTGGLVAHTSTERFVAVNQVNPVTEGVELPTDLTTIAAPMTTTEEPTTPEPTTVGPSDVDPTVPVIEPRNSRLIFRQPTDCSPSDCEIFIGINTNAGNNDYLDIYLEGEAVGWVAVGFTETDNMFSADVVACNRNPDTGVVTAYDTWNPVVPARGNLIDPTQDIVQFSATEEDGRIRCSVAKRIAGSDAEKDLNLNAPYYVIYARRNFPSSAGGLVVHFPTERFVTVNQVNPVTEGVELPTTVTEPTETTQATTGSGRGLTMNCVSISFSILVVTTIIAFFDNC